MTSIYYGNACIQIRVPEEPTNQVKMMNYYLFDLIFI